jgi:hypothetical protein
MEPQRQKETKQPDGCINIAETLENVKAGNRDVELVIGADGEIEAKPSSQVDETREESIGSIGTKAYYLN